MADRRSLPPYEDELSLALLRSAEHDEPSAGAYAKVATALGVSAAVGLGASLPALVSSGASSSAAARWSGSLLAKGAVVGLSSVLLAVGGAALLAHRSQAPARSPAGLAAGAPASAPLAARPVSVAPKNASLTALPVPVPAALPAEALANAVPAPTPHPDLLAAAGPVALKSPLARVRGPRAAKTSSLPQQVLSLDRARVALNSGDAGAALAEIAHYRSAWPSGVFLTEASVLEIQALAKRGEVALAGARAQAFVTAHPDSPQAERLRALIPGYAR
jgi:hypothetical protein